MDKMEKLSKHVADIAYGDAPKDFRESLRKTIKEGEFVVKNGRVTLQKKEKPK